MKRAWVFAVALLALTACDESVAEPPASGTELAIGLALTETLEFQAIFKKLDAAELRMTRPDGPVRVLTVPIEKIGTQLRITALLTAQELVDGLRIEATAKGGAFAFFAGAGTVTTDAGHASATIPMKPVIGRIDTSVTTLSFDALGQSAPLPTGIPRFPSGDVIPGGTLTWSVKEPGVVELVGGTVVTKGNGRTALIPLYAGSQGPPIQVSVNQVATSVTGVTAPPTLTSGQTYALTFTAVDKNGFPLGPGGFANWQVVSNDRTITIARTGHMLAKAPGTGVVTAGGAGGNVTVRVVAAADSTPFLKSGIRLMSYGGVERVVTTNGAAIEPTWHPDHRQFAYILSNDIWIGDLAGNNHMLVTGSYHNRPEFSLDGAWIYVATRATPTGPSSIQRIHPDGTGRETLTSGLDANHPTSSPDGKRFAYMSGGRLYVQDIGAATGTIIPGVTGASNPKWSPDGRWIAVLRESLELWFVSPDGLVQRRAGSPGIFPQITWSPDSHWVLGPQQIASLDGEQVLGSQWAVDGAGISWGR